MMPSVVALGGGHGLAASLRALRGRTGRLTAVVTVADNGGSSGRLRRELGVIAPGDLRMALAALCDDRAVGETGDREDLGWAGLVQHRFTDPDELRGHPVGNLLLVAVWEQHGGDVVAGLERLASLVDARGTVLPMSTVPLDIVARVRGADPAHPEQVTDVMGQVEVATTPGQVLDVRLSPNDPPAASQALAAIRECDWVVLGPGSWFTSVIPHLLVPELRRSLEQTRARRMVVLNLDPQPGETADFEPDTHLEVLARHAPSLRLDVVLADTGSVSDPDRLREAAAAYGAEVVMAPLRVDDGSARHDHHRLATAYERVMSGRWLDRTAATAAKPDRKDALWR
ncbi:MAG: uridine diphosphate-N-acetylglucosamine-binding protein YvcK [Actinomycetes bacterium]